MDLGGLLGRIVPDAITLLDRVLQQAQEQLHRDGEFAGAGGTSPDEVVVTALGNRLARMIVSQDVTTVEDFTDGFPADELSPYEELIDRNSILAAALGACDCWGQHLNCPFREGLGGPGWALPDERLIQTPILAACEYRLGSCSFARLVSGCLPNFLCPSQEWSIARKLPSAGL